MTALTTASTDYQYMIHDNNFIQYFKSAAYPCNYKWCIQLRFHIVGCFWRLLWTNDHLTDVLAFMHPCHCRCNL